MKTRSQRMTGLAVAVALAAFVAPAASAGHFDARSPDTKNVAKTGNVTSDFRSPDTAAAALGDTTPVIAVATDLRSPDTVAAAALAESPRQATPPTTITIVDSGFGWTHAFIGAVVGFAIALLLAAAFIAVRPGHRGGPVAPRA